MLTCIDTCCLINLINGSVLDVIASTLGRNLQYQGLVEDEIQSHVEVIESYAARGLLTNLSGAGIFASEVGRIADEYNIGLGEAECIAISLKSGCGMASDDGKARRAAKRELGEPRITGSLGLLSEAVRIGSLSPDKAHEAYQAMKTQGGFLPRVPPRYFHAVLA